MLEQKLPVKSSDNLRLVSHAWIDALNRRDLDEFVNSHSESVVMYDPTFGKPLKGRNALRS